jgi:hypothetical protein
VTRLSHKVMTALILVMFCFGFSGPDVEVILKV